LDSIFHERVKGIKLDLIGGESSKDSIGIRRISFGRELNVYSYSTYQNIVIECLQVT
jgi:hypothetical protein